MLSRGNLCNLVVIKMDLTGYGNIDRTTSQLVLFVPDTAIETHALSLLCRSSLARSSKSHVLSVISSRLTISAPR